MTPQQSWFAVAVKRRQEKTVAQTLRQDGHPVFLPLYGKFAGLLLFPGYVFCRFDHKHSSGILSTPGITSIVGFTNIPTPLFDADISRILTILASGLPARPWPCRGAGQIGRIEGGQLAGLERVHLREGDSLRGVVAVESLRRAVAVEIGHHMICATECAAQAEMAHLYLTA